MYTGNVHVAFHISPDTTENFLLAESKIIGKCTNYIRQENVKERGVMFL